MDSEPKKQQLDDSSDSESEEEWIDMLADTIIDNKNWETKEKSILEFLLYWLDVTICNKKHKKDVWKLEKAMSILKEHEKRMNEVMSKGKEFEEMEIERDMDEEANYEYIMRRGDVYISDVDDDDSGPEESCGGKA
jgi:hypothetical protein